jgi:hypothetical protein
VGGRDMPQDKTKSKNQSTEPPKEFGETKSREQQWELAGQKVDEKTDKSSDKKEKSED